MEVLIIALSVILVGVTGEFVVPTATVKAFSPIGFSASIPDIPGIQLFAFHGSHDGKTFLSEASKPENGVWKVAKKDIQLKPGDVLHYWTYVDYFDGIKTAGFTNMNQMFHVQTTLTTTTAKPNTTKCIPCHTRRCRRLHGKCRNDTKFTAKDLGAELVALAVQKAKSKT